MAARNGEGNGSSQGGAGSHPQSQPTPGAISEELCYHTLDCPFYVMTRQKTNLLTDSELHAEMVAHYLRKWNTTLESSGGSVVARAMAYSNQALETGHVRDYLSSQRSYLDGKIQEGLAKCQCVTAKIPPTNVAEENVVKVEVEQGGLEGATLSPPVLVKEEPIKAENELGQNGTEKEERVVLH